MGKIKKILENELVGGTQGTDVYPVTSTKAVYDENNVRLDTILKPATKEAAGLMSPEDKKNIDDKLSKSEGGEVNKPIVITDEGSEYKTIINTEGSIYVLNKNTNKNVFSLINTNKGVIINNNVYAPIRISRIGALYDEHNNVLYNGTSNIFHANGFIINNGTSKQVLLGDGSTTDRLIKDVTAGAIQSEYNLNFITTGNVNNFVTIKAATSTTAGVMTAADKAKLDDIEHTYVSTQNGNIYSSYDTNNGNTTLDVTGNYDEEGSGGRIRLKRTEDGKGKLSIMIDGQESSVNAEQFNSIISPNKNEVWSTDGGRINVLNLLSNATIYVAGGFELAESGMNNTTVIDSPDRIIYDDTVLGGRFLAKKGMTCYTHWKADISKNIAPPSRYGIETDNGVFPFNNQMYKFSAYDSVFIATCSDGECTMKHLQ